MPVTVLSGIQAYMGTSTNIKDCRERTAEDIKIKVGSALPDLENPPADLIVEQPYDCPAYWGFRFRIRNYLLSGQIAFKN